MTKSLFNPDQIRSLTKYGLDFGVQKYTLNAYISDPGIKDEQGYTKSHNADVGRAECQPAHLAQTIQQLATEIPGTDITISSKVLTRDGTFGHIPMLDMKIPYVPYLHQNEIPILNTDVDRYLVRIGRTDEIFGPARQFVSGNSFHLYGLDGPPVSEEGFLAFIAAVLVCDHDLIVDHAWLGFSLQRREFRLRLTAVQAKYKMVPTESWKTDTLAALKIQDEVAAEVVAEPLKRDEDTIPF